MSKKEPPEPRRLDLRGSMAALRAREEVAGPHTDLVIVRNGKLERVSPLRWRMRRLERTESWRTTVSTAS
jgi:hypothetical protein